ncbi:3-hydroxyisobutyryl-CoA hydrolase, mitochondrial-like isoform X2 [Choristoneura fumiferana]
MGGGLGVSVHGRYRVATENTVVAMPETKIGLLPDVGGTYFLPRLKHHIGFYMGLTGQRFKGKDAVSIGIATHFVPSSRLPDLEADLTRCSSEAQIRRCLAAFSVQPGPFTLNAQIKHIDYCFSAGTVEEVIQRLLEVNNEWSNETLKILAHMCPTMLKVTLRALHRGKQQDLAQCLQMEYRVTTRCPGSHNLREGVRALLIDRDNKPQWMPATLAEVTDDEVNSYFERLPEHMELKFSNSKL